MSHLSTTNTNIQYSIRLTQNESLPSQFLDRCNTPSLLNQSLGW